MAQSAYPFEGIDTTETQFSQMFRTLNGGVNGTPSGTELKVSAGTGLQVSVAAGQAMVRGHFYISTAAEALSLDAAHATLGRVDSVVLTLDPTANSVVLAVVKGTPASTPVAPALTQTDAGVYQLLLATVLVPATATVPSTITDSRTFMGARFGLWTTATRPGSPTVGQAGFNTTTSLPELWNGSAWSSFLPAAGTVTNAMLANSAITVNGSATSLGGSVITTGDVAGKNKIINGAFDFWYRGASFINVNGTYTSDRWVIARDGSTSVSGTKQIFTPGVAPVSGYESEAYMRLAGTVVSSSAFYLEQRVEDVRTFAGQTATLSYWAKADTATTNTPLWIQNFGAGGSAGLNGSNGSHSITTSWQRFSVTFSIPSISGKTIGSNSYLALHVIRATTSATIDIWGVQLEAGSVATPFSRAGGTLAGELAACQRYFQRVTSPDNNIGAGVVNALNGAYIFVTHKQKMRATATVSGSTAGSAIKLISPTGTQYTVTSFSAAVSGDGATLVNANIGSNSLVVGQGTVMLVGNPDYFDLSAEL